MPETQLPVGWNFANLENIVDILDSRRIPINNDERQRRIEGKTDSELYPYYGATGEVGKIDGYLFDEELIALGEDGVPFFDTQKNKAYMIYGKAWVNNHAHVLKAFQGTSINKYICHFLNQFDYQNYVNGGTRLKLTQANMRRIPIPFPPLAEQKVIADKLDTLLAQVESTKACLERIPDILKRFRQSVLAAAVSGKLTESDVLQTSTIGEISQVIGGLTKNSKRQEYPNKLPYLRVANVYENEFRLDDLAEIGIQQKELERVLLQENDLLIVEGNGSLDQIGRVALWDERVSPCVHQNHLIKVRTDPAKAHPKFLLYYLMSPQGKSEIIEKATSGAGLYTLSLSKISSISIDLFTLEEQEEIVRRVEELFAFADNIERQVQNAQQRVNQLTQSILAKAFRGELTADWRAANPDLISGDNSAEALLAKIKAERKKLEPQRKTRGKQA